MSGYLKQWREYTKTPHRGNKKCPYCGKNKLLSEFHPSHRKRTSAWCKECCSLYAEQLLRDKEAIAQLIGKYPYRGLDINFEWDGFRTTRGVRNQRYYRSYAQRLRRALKNGPIDYKAIKVRDRMRCCVCGKKVKENDLSFDHSIPISLGGPHTQENLRVCHRRCNSRRGPGRLPVQMVLV